MKKPLLLRPGFLISLVLGVAEFRITRFVIFSDGVSYLEIARRYAGGQWKAAVNAYWSPLLSWVLAAARLATGNSDRYELTCFHLVNFLAFVTALVLFERLLSCLWPQQASTSHPAQYRCYRICGYCLFLWASLHLIGIGYCSPDMIVLALNEAAAILLLEIARRPGRVLLPASLGAVLALSFLTKTAFFPVSFLYIVVTLWILRKQPRRLASTAVLVGAFALLCLPWLLALHQNQGKWTFGESGRLNYAWEVDGAPRSIHWQGEPGNIGHPQHPTRHIFSHPDVYEFGAPLRATYAPWLDPVYWYAGITPGFHPAAQARVLARDLRYAAFLLCLMPGCLAAVAAALLAGRGSELLRRTGDRASLLVPSVATILMYCLVYVDSRYIAGPLLILGLVVLCAAFPLLHRDSQLRAASVTALSVFLFFVPWWLLMARFSEPEAMATVDQQALLAREVRAAGLRRGDHVAYVGFGISAYWALLDGIQITAEVPPVYTRRGGLENDLSADYSNLNAFWSADAATRNRMFTRLKSTGVRAIVANFVPAGADTRGWIRLQGIELNGRGYEHLYIRFL